MPRIFGQQRAFKSYTPWLKRLLMGPLLKWILGNIDRSRVGRPEQNSMEKMFMLSGHDSTIAGFLNAFGAYDLILVPFAGAVMIEFHRDPKYSDFHINVSHLQSFNYRLYLI